MSSPDSEFVRIKLRTSLARRYLNFVCKIRGLTCVWIQQVLWSRSIKGILPYTNIIPLTNYSVAPSENLGKASGNLDDIEGPKDSALKRMATKQGLYEQVFMIR